jgi:dipeptide/tripeptide permease
LIAILALFLHHKLNFDNDEATALYHTNEFIMYIFTIIGAVIADAFLGVFKTIALMTSISALGSVVLMTGSLEISDLPNK